MIKFSELNEDEKKIISGLAAALESREIDAIRKACRWFKKEETSNLHKLLFRSAIGFYVDVFEGQAQIDDIEEEIERFEETVLRYEKDLLIDSYNETLARV